jgi:hypothetical protein
MNIESILDKIYTFEELVIESGFQRDIVDWINALQYPHNRNIAFMAPLVESTCEKLIEINNSSLSTDLDLILDENEDFTSLNSLEKLDNLTKNTEITTEDYCRKFLHEIQQLEDRIQNNNEELESLKSILQRFIPESFKKDDIDKNKAIVSIKFNDQITTKSLLKYNKSIHNWNKALLSYHQLLKSESPEEITIEAIQSGSIDLIINLNLDVAFSLSDLFVVGFIGFQLYLKNKERVEENGLTEIDNDKLRENLNQRDQILLDNLSEGVHKKVEEQHTKAKENDSKIEAGGSDRRIQMITDAITDHIIKNNEFKLLTHKENLSKNEEEGEIESTQPKINTNEINRLYKKLKEEEIQLLLDKYELKDDENKPPTS